MNFRPEDPNLAQLLAVATRLEPLLERIAFVGGCVTGLLATSAAAAPVRVTVDVDVIVEAATYAEFTVLEQQLRQLGFRKSRQEGAPVCRWVSGDLVLDFMPVDPSILGFSNRWYAPAIMAAQKVPLGGREIRVITAPYFIATKLEAFRGRGRSDFSLSRDLEDIVTVIDGRREINVEILAATPELQRYLSDGFRALLSNRDFLESLPGHLLPDRKSQQRIGIVVGRMRQMILEG